VEECFQLVSLEKMENPNSGSHKKSRLKQKSTSDNDRCSRNQVPFNLGLPKDKMAPAKTAFSGGEKPDRGPMSLTKSGKINVGNNGMFRSGVYFKGHDSSRSGFEKLNAGTKSGGKHIGRMVDGRRMAVWLPRGGEGCSDLVIKHVQNHKGSCKTFSSIHPHLVMLAFQLSMPFQLCTPVPLNDAPSIMQPPFSWKIQMKIDFWSKK